MTSKAISTISVIGLGYIGLPTAATIASRKVKVIGVDVSQKTVDTINRGCIHIVEPELDAIVHDTVARGYLRATTTPEPADVFIIAVPTPFEDGHKPDLSYIHSAIRAIGQVIKKGDIVILESTSPVGTTEQMAQWLAEERPELAFPIDGATQPDVHVAYCPERVLPGHVIRELVENDRIIGGLTPACSKQAMAVYRLFVKGALLETTARTAEMSKLTENAFRDVNIAFANELSLICNKIDVDVWELIRLANRHPRVNVLKPGVGVGGHCIAVDPWFIVDKTPDEARLIRMAREVNDSKPNWIIQQIKSVAHAFEKTGNISEKPSILLLGLAFKPDIDDLRESPAMKVARNLQEDSDYNLLIVEPNINALPTVLERNELCTLEDALERADIVAVLVGHREFRNLKLRLPCQFMI